MPFEKSGVYGMGRYDSAYYDTVNVWEYLKPQETYPDAFDFLSFTEAITYTIKTKYFPPPVILSAVAESPVVGTAVTAPIIPFGLQYSPMVVLGGWGQQQTSSMDLSDIKFRKKWYYCTLRIDSEDLINYDTDVGTIQISHHEAAMRTLNRAAALGYNGVCMQSSDLVRYKDPTTPLSANVMEFRDRAAELGMEVIPIAYGFNTLFVIDPTCVDGWPVTDQVFVVRGSTARHKNYASDLFSGHGGFENTDAVSTTGYFRPYYECNLDTDVYRAAGGGSSSLRCGPFTEPTEENPDTNKGYIYKVWTVTPQRIYRLRFYMKTENLTEDQEVYIGFNARGYDVSPTKGNPYIVASKLGSYTYSGTQDWTRYDYIFSTYNYTSIDIVLGVQGGVTDGTAWFDDMFIEELGLMNIIRTDDTPLTVCDVGGNEYVEGVDYAYISDPLFFADPNAPTDISGSFGYGVLGTDHPQPAITVLPGSNIRDGEELYVSYCTVGFGHTDTGRGTCFCKLNSTLTDEAFRTELRIYERIFHPTTVFLNHDEIRLQNWINPTMTTGAVLAANIKRTQSIIYEECGSDTEIVIWNDLLDPFHNAHTEDTGYYQVNGWWADSWIDLDRKIIIMNWNYTASRVGKSTRFFASRGNRQIIAGYYDGSASSLSTWMSRINNKSNIQGFMYSTFVRNFNITNMRAFMTQIQAIPEKDVIL